MEKTPEIIESVENKSWLNVARGVINRVRQSNLEAHALYVAKKVTKWGFSPNTNSLKDTDTNVIVKEGVVSIYHTEHRGNSAQTSIVISPDAAEEIVSAETYWGWRSDKPEPTSFRRANQILSQVDASFPLIPSLSLIPLDQRPTKYKIN